MSLMASVAPVAITPLGPVSAATVVWRRRGRLSVTVAVKATFAIAPETRMTPMAPDPIAPDEQSDPSGRGLRAAGDLAPYLRQADVLLTGHAEVPPTFSAPEIPVWLAVVRDGAMRIDKRLELDASARVGAARAHVHIDGMGPLSREWPKRSQLLGGADPRRLQGTDIDVPDGFDWTYFQAAPADQRMDPLQGDEWLVLGGIVMRRPKLRTQLPEARGVARLYRRGQAPPRTAEPIQLLADTLQIDTDRHCVSIVWRGHAPAEQAELGALHIVASVELPGQQVAWADPFAGSSAQTARVVPPARSSRPDLPVMVAAKAAAESPFEGTMAIDEEVLAKLAAAQPALGTLQRGGAAPAATAPPVPAAPVSSMRAAPPPSAPSVRAAPAPSVRPSAPLPAQPLAMMDNPLEGTMALSTEVATMLKSSVATPFEARNTPHAPARAAPPQSSPTPPQSKPSPPKSAAALPRPIVDNPLEGTMALSTEVATMLKASVATPFEARNALNESARAISPQGAPAPAPPSFASAPSFVPAPIPVAPTPYVPAPPASSPYASAPPASSPYVPAPPASSPYAPGPSTFSPAAFSPAASAPYVPAPYAPTPVSAPSAPGATASLAPDELAAWPPGLGAEFLAAMADAGALA